MSDLGEAPQHPPAPGAEQYNRLVAGGFSQQEAAQWRDQQTQQLRGGGFSEKEIGDYWGDPPASPASSVIADHVAKNIAAAPDVAGSGPAEAFAAGWGSSVTGLALAGKDTTRVLPKDAGLLDKVSNAVGQGIGDLPATIAGAIAGAGAGAAVPVAGETGIPELVGAGAGSAAIPQASREALVAAYRAGDIHTWQDAVAVAGGATARTLKVAAAGAIGGLVGGQVGTKMVEAGASQLIAGGANAASMAVTSTAAGAVMDGRVPDAQDFVTGTILALGAHAGFHAAAGFQMTRAGAKVQNNLQEIYAKTGIPPWEATERAKTDPVLRQEMMAQDPSGQSASPKFYQQAKAEPEPAQGKPQAASEGAPKIASVEDTMPLVRALEGSGDHAVSPAGAVGRYQIMPSTARLYGFDPAQLKDPAYSEQAARAILTDLNHKFHGDQAAVLAAYNAGPGRAVQLQKAGPGTRLVAELDKTAPGGVRYTSEPASRDESFLPTETQKYLANGRRRADGELPGQVGGGQKPPPPPPPPDVGGDPEKFWKAQPLSALEAKVDENLTMPVKPNDDLLNPNKLYDQFVSELGPLRRIDEASGIKAGDQGLTPLEQAGYQTYGSTNRASAMTRYGPVDFETKTIDPKGPSLFKAFQAAKEDGGNAAGFVKYMVAKRATRLEAEGVTTGFDPTAVKALAEHPEANAMYDRARQIMNAYTDGGLQYGRDAGLFSDAQIEAMQGDDYIKFTRDVPSTALQDFGAGQGKRPNNPLKKMTGSNRAVVDPLGETMSNVQAIVRNADRNELIGQILAKVSKLPEGLSIEKVEEGAPDQPLAFQGERELGATQFPYYRDGVREVWQTNDPDLAALLRGADTPGQVDIFTKILGLGAKLTRAGIANLPDFIERVLARHQWIAFIADPDHPTPYVTAFKGAMSAFKADEHYQQFLANGGAGSAMADMDVNVMSKDLHDLVSADQGMRPWNTVRSFGDAWQALAERGDAIFRGAQTISSRADASQRVGFQQFLRDKGETDESFIGARSSKSYINFAERGTLGWLNSWARFVPFMRPAITGSKFVIEAFRDRPGQTLAYTGLAVVAPTILAYAANYLQDQYGGLPENRKFANLPRWEKDTMLHLPEIDGVRLRIPYPYVVGPLFGGMTTRFLDYLVEHDPAAFKDVTNLAWETLVPSTIPAIALPVLESVTDHNFFTGRKLIPASVEGASGSMQYTDSTSETGKALSKFVAGASGDAVQMSPIQFDNYVKEWGGTWGSSILKLVDGVARPGAPAELTDIPMVKTFLTTHPGMSSAPIQQFFDHMDEFNRAATDAKLAIDRVNPDEISKYSVNPMAYVRLQGIERALMMQGASVKSIYADKTLTDSEKRQNIENVYSQMIETAKAGNQMAEGLKQ